MKNPDEWLTEQFRSAGFEQPGLEARVLLAEIPSPDLLAKWLAERLRGVPLAYLSGRKGFYKDEFFVGPGVLIPRPETEHVLEVALERGREIHHFADLGCGSGCLGLSLLREWPESKLYAVDASEIAVEFCKRNAAHLGLIGRSQVLTTRVEDWKPMFLLDLVVANPPYIPEGDPQVQPSVHAYEPHAALYSGADGLHAIRSWSAWAARFLAPGALFVSEFGVGQGEAFRAVLTELKFEQIQIQRDLAGHERVISGYKAGGE